jgi:hypothetical protein
MSMKINYTQIKSTIKKCKAIFGQTVTQNSRYGSGSVIFGHQNQTAVVLTAKGTNIQELDLLCKPHWNYKVDDSGLETSPQNKPKQNEILK